MLILFVNGKLNRTDSTDSIGTLYMTPSFVITRHVVSLCLKVTRGTAHDTDPVWQKSSIALFLKEVLNKWSTF